MERSIFAVLIGGFLGVTTLGGFAYLSARSNEGSAPFPSPSPSAAPIEPSIPSAPGGGPEGGWRLLDPVTYQNISIFPVVSSSSQDTSAFLTLEDGLSSGEVIVREQGSEGNGPLA